MSSKQPAYPQLTRANYEEFFLLYVDGELSPEAMDAVDAFAALHPDLQDELQTLLDTRLDAEPLSLGDLSFLQAAQMQQLTREEELLSYIDNELDAPTRAALERDLAADPALRAELASFEATRLPAETVSCPFQEELYRREEKRRPLFWLPRVAAAVLLLGAGSLLWRMNSNTQPGSNHNITGGNTVALRNESPAPQPAPQSVSPTAAQPATATPAVPTILAASTKTKAPKTNRISTDAIIPQAVAKDGLPPAPKERGVPESPAPVQYAFVPDPRDKTPDPRDRNPLPGSSAANPLVNPTLANPAVTSASTASLYDQNNGAQPTATEAVYREEGRQNSVRGFLRKATRFIEKRTGIKTTNEDDQLVVGGVAINLK